MLTYCDSSAAVALVHPDETERADVVVEALRQSSDVAGCEWISPLEVTAAISRRLKGRGQREAAEKRWQEIWERMVPVGLDRGLCEFALAAAREHRLRSLDALHLAAAVRIGCDRMLTFDRELAKAARAHGLHVMGG